MYLRSIRRRYTFCALLLALSIFCTVWFDPRQMDFSIAWSLVIVFLVGFFVRQSQMFQTAKLIWDNRILVISRTFSDKRSRTTQEVDEMVLSTFGMLSSGQLYEWGRRGLWGVRLKTMDLDPKKMRLSFGNESQAMWLEFEHGIESKQKILEVVQKLWRETGVEATIQGL